MHANTDRVDIDIRIDVGICLIKVADHGNGIPDKIKERIFDEGSGRQAKLAFDCTS